MAFSKKLEKFEAAVGLHFAYYNFVKRHGTLRCTQAMAAGVHSLFLRLTAFEQLDGRMRLVCRSEDGDRVDAEGELDTG